MLHAGETLHLSDTDAQSSEYLAACLTEPGARLRLVLPTETPMKPVLPLIAPAALASETPEPEAAAPNHAEAHEPAPVVEAEESAPKVAETHASTEVAEPNGVPDLSQIQGLAGGNPIVTVILALILVGGGTAGWKFWNQKSKQNHELRLQELELQKEMAGLQGAQPPPCQAANVKLQADITALQESKSKHEELHRRLDDSLRSLADRLSDAESRLGKIERKATSLLSGDFDPDELAERLEKTEKEIKAMKTAAKAASTKKS